MEGIVRHKRFSSSDAISDLYDSGVL